MRNLYDVINQIVEVAPDLEENLNSIRESVMYSAPENMGMWWNMTAEILNEYALDHPKADKIAAIFSGKEVGVTLS